MKVRDLIAAVRDYPALRQALEESNAELDLSRMECAQLQSKINELEPLIDEYYQESCSKEYAANQERQIVETLKKAFASFYPALDSTEQLRRFYDTIAPDFDEGGFRLYDAALAISGYPNIPGEFPYEDNRGVFDYADGHQLLQYLTALRFHAVRWGSCPARLVKRLSCWMWIPLPRNTGPLKSSSIRGYCMTWAFRTFCPRSRSVRRANKKKNGRKVLSDRTET